MAHLPLSYENRCPQTWFALPNVNYYRDNPLHFCSQSRDRHPDNCVCKCGAIEGFAITAEPLSNTRQESNGRGSDGSESPRMD
jgi:hypothetical protein